MVIRAAISGLALLGIVLGACLMDPSTRILVGAVRELGPVAGWRCAESPTYTYDPSQEQPDPTLLPGRPEMLVYEREPGLVVDSVEVNLRSGEAVVATHAAGPTVVNERVVFVLSPGHMVASTYCQWSLDDWQIIGEQHLG